MNRITKYLLASMASLLLAVSLPTNAATMGQINQARAECHSLKQQVKALGSFARDDQRQAWEAACGHANALMDESGGAEIAALEMSPGPATEPAIPALEPEPAPAAMSPAPATTEPLTPTAEAEQGK